MYELKFVWRHSTLISPLLRTVAPGIYCTQTAQFQPSRFLSRLNISFSCVTSSGGGRRRHTVPADDKRPVGLCLPRTTLSMGKTDLQSASCQITVWPMSVWQWVPVVICSQSAELTIESTCQAKRSGCRSVWSYPLVLDGFYVFVFVNVLRWIGG
jgi:hypothetical protein